MSNLYPNQGKEFSMPFQRGMSDGANMAAPLHSGGNLTTKGFHINRARRKRYSLISNWNFNQSCDGTNIIVNPGVWSIFGIGSASGGGTLALGSASETWVCLRRPVYTLGAELCKVDGSTRPAANDSSFYYLVLCHCVKTGGIWTIAQRCWRGDFYESAPVINA